MRQKMSSKLTGKGIETSKWSIFHDLDAIQLNLGNLFLRHGDLEVVLAERNRLDRLHTKHI